MLAITLGLIKNPCLQQKKRHASNNSRRLQKHPTSSITPNLCFCGDFRQILPVVPRGTHGQIVSACLKHSPLWHHIQHLPLTINMRLFSPQMSPKEQLCQEEFANHILAIGEGRDTNNEIIQWPLNRIVPDDTSQSLANA